jgi:hypothetical protein
MLLTIATGTGVNMNDYVYDFDKFASSLEHVIIAVTCITIAGVLAFGYQWLKNRDTKKYSHLCDRRWEAMCAVNEEAGLPIPVVKEYDTVEELIHYESIDERTKVLVDRLAGDRS